MILERGVAIGKGQVPQIPGFGHEHEIGQPNFSCQGHRGTLLQRWRRSAGLELRPAESAQQ
jgi:hypothetical protein